jgi:hypothetical protein
MSPTFISLNGFGAWSAAQFGVGLFFWPVILVLLGGGFGGLWADGATPEEALDNAWRDIVRLHCEQNSFLRIHNCPSDVYIPGDGPQTWVRWSETKHTWVDATPTPRALLVHNIPADRIRLYSDHRWREDR